MGGGVSSPTGAAASHRLTANRFVERAAVVEAACTACACCCGVLAVESEREEISVAVRPPPERVRNCRGTFP